MEGPSEATVKILGTVLPPIVEPAKLQYKENSNDHDLARISTYPRAYKTKIPIHVSLPDGRTGTFDVGSMGEIWNNVSSGQKEFRIGIIQIRWDQMVGGRRRTRSRRHRRTKTSRRRHTSRRR